MTTVVAVIAVFNAPPDLPLRVARLSEQVHRVVLVDDGSHSLHDFPAIESVELLTIEQNSGIAHALNAGVGRARQLGASHLLLLDQDSDPPTGYVRSMLAAMPAPHPVIVVPGQVGGAPILRDRRSREPFDPVQSGQMMRVDVYESVGPFNESYFIDAVDSEYTVRARDAGVSLQAVDDAHLPHSLGLEVPFTVLGRPLALRGRQLKTLYHTPIRTYYMVRNSVRLWGELGRGHQRWMIRRTIKLAEMVVGCWLSAPDRASQRRAILIGFADGLRGVGGRISEPVRYRIDRRTQA